MTVLDHARFGTRVAREVIDVRNTLEDLPPGWWAVVVTFEGRTTAIRYATLTPAADLTVGEWCGLAGRWRSSMTRADYIAGVEQIRARIAAGTIYQVNLCRILSQPLEHWPDLAALAAVLDRGNPAPYAGLIDAPSAGVGVVCASPELYLSIDGTRIRSGPIKGTAPTPEALLPKDVAENVMIVDLVRNDLSRICAPGTVEVEALCALEHHPGLVHLTSYIGGQVRAGTTWPRILDATFPPGSVSGAPKSTALATIGAVETSARDAYCGAIGWIDTRDPWHPRAELAVGIRTFFVRPAESGPELCFGTGAGITWDSDPAQEWAETELKAARLIDLATGSSRTRDEMETRAATPALGSAGDDDREHRIWKGRAHGQ
ncbi:MAG TPA: chorismate-binding protein [Intrasporangiaceae bacterium]|nr:chorismate-binding protein [Intrasporangiaceae bacterium]